MQAILLHGTCPEEEYFSDVYPSLSNSHWFPWLQKQLLMRSIVTQTPEVPEAHKPQYKKWQREFEKQGIDENSIVVGHSCGGGFLLRWLSENKQKVAKLVLVAPWLDPERTKTTDYFDFTIDPDLPGRVGSLHLLVSDDDDKDILTSVELISKALPSMPIRRFADKGHFTYDAMGTEEFPELLELLTS